MKLNILQRIGVLVLLCQGSWAFQASFRPPISRPLTTSSLRADVMEGVVSEECTDALVTAQHQCQRMQAPEVGPDIMLVSCIEFADEAPALDETFLQYGIVMRPVVTALKNRYADMRKKMAKDTWWVGAREQFEEDYERPFRKDLKNALTRAGNIAIALGSPSVDLEHVFLALLGYQKKKGKVYCSADAEPKKFAAWTLLQLLPRWDPQTKAIDLCKTLLEKMGVETMPDDDKPPPSIQRIVRQLKGVEGIETSIEKAKPLALEDCGVDLTQQARDGQLDPVFGRDEEIRSCLRTLLRRRKNCVCLIGDPGVGKTAVAEGVAQILVDETKCPARLKGYRVFSLELSTLVAGSKYRGEFEQRLQGIIANVTDASSPPTILFMDEFHNLVGAGAVGGGMDAANLLKPVLARGTLQLIGATTVSEYRKSIEKDAALERRLQPVMVKESSVEQTHDILKMAQPKYESHHRVTYTPEALKAAVNLSGRYIPDRFFPDKALDLLDESGAFAQLENLFEDSVPVVDEHVVASVISDMCGIPIGKLESSELDRLKTLESQLEGRVKGQTRAVRTVARAIRRARSGLRDPKRPVASLFFAGPTGTGKTELCKTLAETYYGSEKDMIRIDMSEFQEKFTISRLIGSPPGYVGYEEAGQLTEAVRRSPHSVVLLDEVEKAHEDVLNILLQVMEDGMLTDGKGRTVNFKSTILVMTSNVGSKRIMEVARLQSSLANVAAPSTANVEESVPGPIDPEELLQKVQNNIQASSLLLQATSDPEMMEAIRTALQESSSGSERTEHVDPRVASFLEEFWSIIDEDDKNSNVPTKPQASLAGLTQLAKSADHVLYPKLVEVVKEELEAKMKPELLNRIDEIVVFSPLGAAELTSIAQLMVDRTLARARDEQDLSLEVGPKLINRIVEEGSSKADQFGARPMRRAAQRYVEDTLSDALVQGFLAKGDSARLELASKRSANGKGLLQVTKSDGTLLLVEVEDSSGGIDGASSPVLLRELAEEQATEAEEHAVVPIVISEDAEDGHSIKKKLTVEVEDSSEGLDGLTRKSAKKAVLPDNKRVKVEIETIKGDAARKRVVMTRKALNHNGKKVTHTMS